MTSSQRPGDGEKLKAFPPGFRMVAGDPMKRSYGNDKESAAINYACLDYSGPANSETNDFPKGKCPSGIRAQVFFPSCWDGKNLDSADHKSHMSYPVNVHDYGSCPPSHPVHFVSLFFEVIFSTDKFSNMWYGNKQPFVWSMGDPTGYGLHGDFVNGWDVNVLQKAIDTCTNNSGKVEDCPVFTLTPDNVATGCRIPSSINEQVSGTLDALPGCNPVQAGPARAVAKTDGCKATNTIGKPQAFYTDLTQTKKFAYVGCGYDSIYNRKFTGASTSGDTMTVEKCVDFCTGKGFSVAGMEYGRECYCANSIPADAAPKPGYIGDCAMKCSGDNTEFCGGGGTISLYQKCGSTCKNAEFGVGDTTSPAPSPSNQASPSPSSTPKPSSPAQGGTSPSPSGTSKSSTTSAAPATQPSTNVVLPSGWKALGCYVDPVNPRLFTTWGQIGNDVTSTKCAAYCAKAGFNYGGTEYSGQCFCSKDLPSNAKIAPSSECNMKCTGDSKEICGGPGRLSVFGKSAASKVKRYGHGRHQRRHAQFRS